VDLYRARNVDTSPWITVIIAGFNSEFHIPKLSETLAAQICPVGAPRMEILYVDGGSVDNSVSVAAEAGFTVLDNPFGDPIHAKWIGLLKARAKFVCFLDHDERLTSPTSLVRKVNLMNESNDTRIVITSGYQLDGETSSNQYASEFGDPFSRVVYRTPNRVPIRSKAIAKRVGEHSLSGGVLSWKCSRNQRRILIEPVACGSVIDAEYFLARFPNIKSDPGLVPQLYYLAEGSDPECEAALLIDDGVRHESVESWQQVRRKVRWRARNSGGKSELASSGFYGRNELESSTRTRSKQWSPTWAFFFYVGLVIPLVFDSLQLAITRRSFGYLNQGLLAVQTCFWVLGARLRFLIQKPTELSRYGH
jgi:glycosyltransferase involved in cell wall biosynthesis